jgi:hypothetical protein
MPHLVEGHGHGWASRREQLQDPPTARCMQARVLLTLLLRGLLLLLL